MVSAEASTTVFVFIFARRGPEVTSQDKIWISKRFVSDMSIAKEMKEIEEQGMKLLTYHLMW